MCLCVCLVLKVTYADDHGPHVMRTSTTQLKSPMQKSGIPHQSVRRATNQLYMLYSITSMSPLSSMDTLVAFSF
jgi:hypothetical protein